MNNSPDTAAAPAAEAPSSSLFTEMGAAFSQLEHAPLRRVLLDSVQAEAESVHSIHRSFERFTQAKLPLELRKTFFASWQKTNNSAMSVQGLANRITDEAECGSQTRPPSELLDLYRAAGRLHRVTDEDLGTTGQVIHFELYYRMASGLADNDDQWQSRQYCRSAAAEFKAWLDNVRLKQPIIVGLYSMLVHEGYTHAELETIAPWFERWATECMGHPLKDARKLLAWITVHNGGTEKRHFAHSCAAFEHYVAATKSEVDLGVAEQVFRKYLQLKGAAMRQLDELW